jgi:biopolymer transport protein ExbB
MIRPALRAALLAATLSSASHAQEAPPALDAAYQREVAFLTAERASVLGQLQAARADGDRQSAAQDAALAGLETRLQALQLQAERDESDAADLQGAQGTEEEATTSLAAAWIQARTTLEAQGRALQDAPPAGLDPEVAKWTDAFQQAAAAITAAGAIRTAEEGFFDRDGTELRGRVVRVGQVATFGETPEGVFPLVPVGEGRLRAAQTGGPEAGATGDALLAGRADPAMGLFLHEGRDRRVEEYKERTWAETRELGGVVADAILLLGLAAFSLIAIRTGLLVWLGRGHAAVEAALARVVRGDVAGARADLAAVGGVGPEVVRRMLARPDLSREHLEDLAREALLTVQPSVERFGTTIVVFSTVAPLVGLLGTVSGIITTFEAITRFGNSDPKMLSAGISEALIATEFGLGVAIPSLLIGHLLLGWGETVLGRAENAALRTLNALEDRKPVRDDDGHAAPAAPRLEAV